MSATGSVAKRASCRGAGEHRGGTQGGARWRNRGTCSLCGKNLALTPSGRIPRHVPAKEQNADSVEPKAPVVWDNNDAYGNPLPRGTRRQIGKERSLYRYLGRQIARVTEPAQQNDGSSP